MKIIINGINLKVGGGVTVIMNFLKTVIQYNEFHRHTYHVLVPSGVGYEKFNEGPVHIEIVPESLKSPLKRLYLDHTWLRKRIIAIGGDILFTMGNIAVPSSLPQGVLFMYPYAIYPEEKKVWEILSPLAKVDLRVRNKIFSRRLKYASIIFPQTATSKSRLLKYYGTRIKKIKVIPTAYSKIGEGIKVDIPFRKEIGYIYLLCLTKYYKHKNLEILLNVAQQIEQAKLKFKIITTVEGDQGEGSQEFLDALKKVNLEDTIINIGKVPFDEVPSLYEEIDGLLLPTLLESFSATYADSLMLKVPIFTSDRDFAKDVCGKAGYFFDPLDAKSIVETIVNAFRDPLTMQQKVNSGYERALSFPKWYDVTNMFIEELEALV